MEKYKKIKYLGTSENRGLLDVNDDTVIIEEKIDGANFRFWLEDDKIVFGSRRASDIGKENGFGEVVEYLQEAVDPSELDNDVIYIGEAMVKHSLSYDWDNVPKFIGYDVIHKDTGLPLSFDFAVEQFNKIGLEFVEVLFKGEAIKAREIDFDKMLQRDSSYRNKGKGEGIVIKNYNRLNQYGRPLFGKVVNKSFQEKKEAKFGKSKVKREDAPYIVNKYCTKARIKKIVLKMVNQEGRSLSRDLMNDLIKRVIRDILDESILEMYEQDKRVKIVDFKMLHKLVPQKCLKTLDEMMVNTATK